MTELDHGPELFARLASSIKAVPGDGMPARADVRNDTFLLREEKTPHGIPLRVYYAPFEYINADARIVIVGITPGATQMEVAFQVARDGLRAGLPHEEILRLARRKASFAGRRPSDVMMRRNIATMLDRLGVNAYLGIATCMSLFGEHRDLLHTTPAIRYPAFRKDKNYSGDPYLLTVKLFHQYVVQVLASELQQLKCALIVPLGPAVASAVTELAVRGIVRQEQCLLGFPHPSGANGKYREPQFIREREQMQKKANDWFAVLPPVPTITG